MASIQRLHPIACKCPRCPPRQGPRGRRGDRLALAVGLAAGIAGGILIAGSRFGPILFDIFFN